jgi:hypothetical protein
MFRGLLGVAARLHGSRVEEVMLTNELDNQSPEKQKEPSKGHPVIFSVLSIGLVVSLAGDGYLLKRLNRTMQDMEQARNSAEAQISRLGEATTSLLEQRLQAIDAQM